MLRNYFIITLRSLLKNGVYSFINIAGLTVGIACSILILLWVSDELSWDNFHEKKDRLHRVYVSGMGDNNTMYTQMAVCLPLWEEFKADRDIKYVTPTNWGQTYLITYGEKRLYKQGYYAGEDFLKMFSFPLVKGDIKDQLNDPSGIVLTESAARSLFDNEDPMGKIVRVDDAVDLKVTGIVQDVPSNSTFKFECLIPFTTYMNREPWVKRQMTNWGNYSFNLYVEFAESADPLKVEQRVKDVIKKHEKDSEQEVTFLEMGRWRLYSDFVNGKSVSGQIVYVRMFTVIAIFILVIACINFMNLATARSERRAREVGIRKSIGSKRKELILQFLGETVFIAIIAFILALGLVEATLPFYNGLVNKHLSIDYANPLFWLSATGVILLTGLVAGSYPAFYLSSFNPATVLKGRMQVGKKGSVPRKVMVVVQFVASIFLIISTLVVYMQMNHVKNRPTGYIRENLLYVSNAGDIGKNYKAIKQELLDQGLADGVTTSSSPITSVYAYMGDVEWPGKREDQRASIATVGTGLDYTHTMGIKVTQGRDFSDQFIGDSSSMILNQTAVDYMGLKDPIGETIKWDGKDFHVVGVMSDVMMTSPSRSMDPMMLVFDPQWTSDVTIRLSSAKSPHETLGKVEEIFKKYNPNYPFSYRFADDDFAKKFSQIEFIGSLCNLFSALAILISCLGLFGLAAFTAEQRTKEVGIRKVLGATVSSVVVLLSREFTVLVIIAFAIAAPLAWWLMGHWLEQYSYRIQIAWWILGSAGAGALILAIVVVSFQAIKAAVANPVTSLRNE
jgi:putative ABC transport system permease protein